jgi:hypothetical protein
MTLGRLAYFIDLEQRLAVSLSSSSDPEADVTALVAEMRRSAVTMLLSDYVVDKAELQAVKRKLDGYLISLSELADASGDDAVFAAAAQNRTDSFTQILEPIRRQQQKHENARTRRNACYNEAGYRLTRLLSGCAPKLSYPAAEAVWYLWHSGARNLLGVDVIDPSHAREIDGKHQNFALDKEARARWQKYAAREERNAD